jgi:hypothetical protein
MKLNETDGSLSDICRTVEKSVAEVDCLRAVQLPVKLLADFDSLGPPITPRDPTAYNRPSHTILVNASTFFSFPRGNAQFALAHEIGHHTHDVGITTSSTEFSGVHSCLVADWLAAKWGFEQELRTERLKSRGEEYCEQMSRLTSEDKFLAWVIDWERRFNIAELRKRYQNPPPAS